MRVGGYEESDTINESGVRIEDIKDALPSALQIPSSRILHHPSSTTTSELSDADLTLLPLGLEISSEIFLDHIRSMDYYQVMAIPSIHDHLPRRLISHRYIQPRLHPQHLAKAYLFTTQQHPYWVGVSRHIFLLFRLLCHILISANAHAVLLITNIPSSIPSRSALSAYVLFFITPSNTSRSSPLAVTVVFLFGCSGRLLPLS